MLEDVELNGIVDPEARRLVVMVLERLHAVLAEQQTLLTAHQTVVAENEVLREENVALREELTRVGGADWRNRVERSVTETERLRAEQQQLRDEVARLKGEQGRPSGQQKKRQVLFAFLSWMIDTILASRLTDIGA